MTLESDPIFFAIIAFLGVGIVVFFIRTFRAGFKTATSTKSLEQIKEENPECFENGQLNRCPQCGGKHLRLLNDVPTKTYDCRQCGIYWSSEGSLELFMKENPDCFEDGQFARCPHCGGKHIHLYVGRGGSAHHCKQCGKMLWVSSSY